MPLLEPTPEEKIAGLRQLTEQNRLEIAALKGRIEALEAREAEREGVEATDSKYLQAQIFGAVGEAQAIGLVEQGNSYTGDLK